MSFLSCQIDNPLLNSLIISKMVRYLDDEMLSNSRLINFIWNEESSLELRRRLQGKYLIFPSIFQNEDQKEILNYYINNFHNKVNISNNNEDEEQANKYLISSRLCKLELKTDQPNFEQDQDYCEFVNFFGHFIKELYFESGDYNFLQGKEEEEKICNLFNSFPKAFSFIFEIKDSSLKDIFIKNNFYFPAIKCLTLKGLSYCPEINLISHFPQLKSLIIKVNTKDLDDWTNLNLEDSHLNCNYCNFENITRLHLPEALRDEKIVKNIFKSLPNIKDLAIRAKDHLLRVVYSQLPNIRKLTLIIPNSQPGSLFINSRRRNLPSNFSDEGITGIPIEICQEIQFGNISPEEGFNLRKFGFIGMLQNLTHLKIEKRCWDLFSLTQVSLFCGFKFLKNLEKFDVPCKNMKEMATYFLKSPNYKSDKK